jgi:quercetin dioxygenase-like cupin family protein
MELQRSFKVNMADVPLAQGLREDEGWFDMQVQFAISRQHGGAQSFVFGRTVFPPGAAHEWHRHEAAEEMQYVVRGEGVALTEEGEIPMATGDVLFTPEGEWHGFRNTSDAEVELLWLWGGAGDREQAGYEVREQPS